MTQPPTLNYMSRSVGTFILIAVVIAGVVLFQSARVRDWFDPGQRLRVLLPPDGSFGLEAGADVKMLGTSAGRVLNIRIDEDGRMTALIEVRADFARFVRADSSAIIRKRFSVAGDAYLEVSRGVGEELDRETEMIPARADQVPTETLQVLVDELRGSVIPAVSEARAGIKAWTSFADMLQDPDREFLRTVSSLSEITARIERGEGTVGRLLADEELAQRLRDIVTRIDELLVQAGPIVANIDSTMENIAETSGVVRTEAADLAGIAMEVRDAITTLKQVLAQMQQTTQEFPALARDVRDTAAMIPLLVLQAQSTLQELERTLEGLQEHWLFKGAMPAREVTEPIRPGEALP